MEGPFLKWAPVVKPPSLQLLISGSKAGLQTELTIDNKTIKDVPLFDLYYSCDSVCSISSITDIDDSIFLWLLNWDPNADYKVHQSIDDVIAGASGVQLRGELTLDNNLLPPGEKAKMKFTLSCKGDFAPSEQGY